MSAALPALRLHDRSQARGLAGSKTFDEHIGRGAARPSGLTNLYRRLLTAVPEQIGRMIPHRVATRRFQRMTSAP